MLFFTRNVVTWFVSFENMKWASLEHNKIFARAVPRVFIHAINILTIIILINGYASGNQTELFHTKLLPMRRDDSTMVPRKRFPQATSCRTFSVLCVNCKICYNDLIKLLITSRPECCWLVGRDWKHLIEP